MAGISHAHSVVKPSPLAQRIAGALVVLYALITKVMFSHSVEGYCNLFTTRSRQPAEYIARLPPASGICDAFARTSNMVVVGASNYLPRFANSLIIAFGSTALSVVLGVTAAYAFSRFEVPAKDNLLFFIL